MDLYKIAYSNLYHYYTRKESLTTFNFQKIKCTTKYAYSCTYFFVSNIQQNMLTYVHIFVSDVQQSGLEHSTFVNIRGQLDKKQKQQQTISTRKYLKTEETRLISFKIVVFYSIFFIFYFKNFNFLIFLK